MPLRHFATFTSKRRRRQPEPARPRGRGASRYRLQRRALPPARLDREGASMSLVDHLYPVSMALDVSAFAAIMLFPTLGLFSLGRSGWQQARLTIAFLGYICCAVLVASFAMHLGLDGGVVYMVFVFWLVPFVVAATVAMLITLTMRSQATLWLFATATVLLVLAQAIAERQPGGIGGATAMALLAVFGAYALLVLVVSAYRHDEWCRWPRQCG